MTRWHYRRRTDGFALPSILIVSVVMLMVMLSAVGTMVSITVAQDSAHHVQVAQTAADSGLVKARACLDLGATGTWTAAKPLKPNTDCAGTETFSCSSGATDYRCFVLNTESTRSSFTVTSSTSGPGALSLTSEGTASKIRSSNGQAWRTYTASSRATGTPDLVPTTKAFGSVTMAWDGTYVWICGISTAGEAVCSLRKGASMGAGSWSSPVNLMTTGSKPLAGYKLVGLDMTWDLGGLNGCGVTDKGDVVCVRWVDDPSGLTDGWKTVYNLTTSSGAPFNGVKAVDVAMAWDGNNVWICGTTEAGDVLCSRRTGASMGAGSWSSPVNLMTTGSKPLAGYKMTSLNMSWDVGGLNGCGVTDTGAVACVRWVDNPLGLNNGWSTVYNLTSGSGSKPFQAYPMLDLTMTWGGGDVWICGTTTAGTVVCTVRSGASLGASGWSSPINLMTSGSKPLAGYQMVGIDMTWDVKGLNGCGVTSTGSVVCVRWVAPTTILGIPIAGSWSTVYNISLGGTSFQTVRPTRASTGWSWLTF